MFRVDEPHQTHSKPLPEGSIQAGGGAGGNEMRKEERGNEKRRENENKTRGYVE